MSEDTPAEAATPAEPATADEQAKPATAGEPAEPASRDEALNQLRGDSAERTDTVRGGEILTRGIARLGDPGASMTVFQGDITVEGDMVTGRRGGPRRPTRVLLTDEHVDNHIEYVVPPAGAAEIADIVADTNVGVVSGARRTGRETVALSTLDTVLRRAGLPRRIYLLSGHVLGNGSWRVPVQRCGFLIVDGSGCDTVDDAWLAHASRALQDAGSYLVVVTGPLKGALATAANRADHVLEDLDIPEPMEIVTLRLTGMVPWLPESERRAALELPALAELLEERGEPGFVTRVAVAVADTLRTGGDLAETVARLRDVDGQVREWLGDEPTHQELAFTLATAVLEESTFLNVADAAVSLAAALGGGGSAPRYRRSLFAERTWIEHHTPEGGPPIVRFRHADLRRAVLTWIWYEMDGARQKILDWLGRLADDPDVEVRARAAVAAGVLAGTDFDHGLHRYLRPWAAAGSAAKRQSAALALNVVGSTTGHADRVWEHLERWADQVRFGGKPTALPASAAFAACGRMGEQDPRRALRLLRTLIRHGDWGLLEPVALSANLLLERGQAAEVLDALVEWSEPGADEAELTKALTVFVFAADGGADDRSVLVPAVPTHIEALTELWGRALAAPTVRPAALDALRGWVRGLDADPAALPGVLTMLAGVADRGHQDFNRLRHALADWATDPDAPSVAAADIHDELVEAGVLTA